MHSGATRGDIKMNFGRAERSRYRKHIVPIYGQFLQKCYCTHTLYYYFCPSINDSPFLALEECRARALAPEEGFEALESMDLDAEGATYDTVGPAKPAAPTFSSTTPILTAQDDVNVSLGDPSLPVSAHSRSGSPHSRPASPALSHAVSPPRSAPASPAPDRHFRPVSPPIQSQVAPLETHTPSPSILPEAVPSETPAPSPSLIQTRKRRNEAPPPAEPRSKRLKDGASINANPPRIPRPSRKVTRTASGPATATTSLPEKVQPARKKAPATLVSSLANSTPTVMEGNAPAWFSDSLAMLQSSEIPLGEGWAELVRLWVAFEEKEGFKERRKLSAKDRPECITDWV